MNNTTQISPWDRLLYLRGIDIVIAIIEFKKAENAAAKSRADKEAKRVSLRALLAEKEIQALHSQTVEELQKQLAELEA